MDERRSVGVVASWPVVSGPKPAAGDFDRLEALELQVHQLTSRLAGWVEAQLVQANDDRRADMKALRSDFQFVVEEQLAGLRSETAEGLSGMAGVSAAGEALEQRVRSAMGRLSESLEARLAEVDDARKVELDARWTELRELARRIDDVSVRTAAMADDVVALRTGAADVPARVEGFEQRVKAAIGRLTESVESRVAELARTGASGMEGTRAELFGRLDAVERDSRRAAEVTASLEGFAPVAAERAEALEGRLDAEREAIEARLAEVARSAAASSEALAAIRESAPAAAERAGTVEREVRDLRESVESRIADVIRAAVAAGHRAEALEGELRSTRESVDARLADLSAATGRTEPIEREMADIRQSFETRLEEVAQSVTLGTEAVVGLRSDWLSDSGTLSERVDAMAFRAATVADETTALRADLDAARARTNELELRVKAAVGRLAESVETRLAEQAVAQANELDTATTPLRARFGPMHERIEAVETQQAETAALVGEAIEEKLGEVVEHRRAELDDIRKAMEESLASQLREGRSEIGTAVADAHRRFVVAVDRLEERIEVVADQATAAQAVVADIEVMRETLASDGRRVEALETHTRRTDVRLTDLVAAKLADLAGTRSTELDKVREEVDAFRDDLAAQVAAAIDVVLDAHLEVTRAEVSAAITEGRAELAAGAAQLDARQAALDAQAAKAVAGLDLLSASVDTALREAEERLGDSVQARLDDLDAVAAQVAQARADLAVTSTALTRKLSRSQDQLQKKLAAVLEEVDALARAAAAEAGALAPLRSDVRQLQRQVTELTGLVADAAPLRKAPARKAAATPAAKAGPVKAVPLKAVPAKKAARRRT